MAPFTGIALEEQLDSFSIASDIAKEVVAETAAQMGESTVGPPCALLDELAAWQTSEHSLFCLLLENAVCQAAMLAGHMVAISVLAAVSSVLNKAAAFLSESVAGTDADIGAKEAMALAVDVHIICRCAARCAHLLDPKEVAAGVEMISQLLQHIQRLLDAHEASAWALPCSCAAVLAGVLQV
jgi:hypothetical protein